MTRRHFLTGAILTTTTPLIAQSRRGASTKKGWAGGQAEHHQLFGVHWYYNWMLKGPSEPTEFIPLLKGKPQLTEQALSQLENGPAFTHLLGYNEPERESQGNLSLEEAIEFWPKLQALAETKGARLGSPAPSSDRGGMDWLDAFMQQAKRRKLKVDFIAVHYYRSRNANDLKNFIKDLAKDYRLPIWLTEFNGWTGPREEHEDFLKESLNFLEREKKVERYAYFNPSSDKSHSLLNADGSLTSLGELYRAAGA